MIRRFAILSGRQRTDEVSGYIAAACGDMETTPRLSQRAFVGRLHSQICMRRCGALAYKATIGTISKPRIDC